MIAMHSIHSCRRSKSSGARIAVGSPLALVSVLFRLCLVNGGEALLAEDERRNPPNEGRSKLGLDEPDGELKVDANPISPSKSSAA